MILHYERGILPCYVQGTGNTSSQTHKNKCELLSEGASQKIILWKALALAFCGKNMSKLTL